MPGGGFRNATRSYGRGRVISVRGRAPRIHQAPEVPERTINQVQELMLTMLNREISHLAFTATKRKLTPGESIHVARMSTALARLSQAVTKGTRPEDMTDEQLRAAAGVSR